MKVVAVLRTVQGPRHNALMPHWKLKKKKPTANTNYVADQNTPSGSEKILGLKIT